MSIHDQSLQLNCNFIIRLWISSARIAHHNTIEISFYYYDIINFQCENLHIDKNTLYLNPLNRKGLWNCIKFNIHRYNIPDRSSYDSNTIMKFYLSASIIIRMSTKALSSPTYRFATWRPPDISSSILTQDITENIFWPISFTKKAAENSLLDKIRHR